MENFIEKTIEEIIFENRDRIHEKGLENVFYKNAERQFYLPSGKEIDILTWEVEGDEIKVSIIELKKDAINEAAYWQIFGYYDELIGICFTNFKKFHFTLVLIGSSVCLNVNLACGLTNKVNVYKYSYNFDGIRFEKLNKEPDFSDKAFNMFYGKELGFDRPLEMKIVNKFKQIQEESSIEIKSEVCLESSAVQ